MAVTAHGRPSAVLMAPEDLEALQETPEIMRDAATMNRLAESEAGWLGVSTFPPGNSPKR